VFWFGLQLYSASLAVAWRINALDVTTPAHPTSFFTGVRQGFAWLRGDRNVIGVFVITIIFNIFSSPYASMIPVIFADYFDLDPQGVGLLASIECVGGLLGAVVFVSLARSEWYGRIYLCATAAYFVMMMIGFATAPDARVAAVFLLLIGLSGVGFSVMQATLIDRDSPVEMRGRLLGVLSVCIGTGPIRMVFYGRLGTSDVRQSARGSPFAEHTGVVSTGCP
jgi:predicted MFS family arabinose efflux permease